MTIRVSPDFNEPVHDAVGLVCTPEDGTTDLVVLGSCFAYGRPTSFLTAAHCIGELDAPALHVLLPGIGSQPVIGLSRHQRADAAILQVAEGGGAPAIVPAVAPCVPGVDISVFGYSADILGPQPDRPVPRVFRGYVHRVMAFTSPVTGLSYSATELSAPPPPGVSGGPVIAALGVVAITAEAQSSRVAESSVVTETEGEKHTITTYRLTEFGIGVHLHEIYDWIAIELDLPRGVAERVKKATARVLVSVRGVLPKRRA